MKRQSCSICGANVKPNPRYPRYACNECASRAESSDGRPLTFFNLGLSGGFGAKVAGTDEAYESHVCFVDRVPCWADEAYFGGIVIERMTPATIRAALDRVGGVDQNGLSESPSGTIASSVVQRPHSHASKTPAMPKIPTYLLNLAGEYRICSELNKRGVFSTVTYGTRKGADVYAISDERSRALKIEVKTSQGINFVTSLSQKCGDDDPHSEGFWDRRIADPQAPDFWVLFQILPQSDGSFGERFFVLSHEEICRVQKARNDAYVVKYEAKHGKKPDLTKGVDNVLVIGVVGHENGWQKVVDRINQGAKV